MTNLKKEADDLQMLEEAIEEYQSNPGEDSREIMEEKLLHCIRKSRSVVIDGEEIKGRRGHYNPAGIETRDGFFFAIWTSLDKAAAGEALFPMKINVRAMIRALKNADAAGFALNPKRGIPFVTVDREVLENLLQIADREIARLMN